MQVDCLFPWGGRRWHLPGETRGGASRGIAPATLQLPQSPLRRSPGGRAFQEVWAPVDQPGARPRPLISVRLAAHRQAGAQQCRQGRNLPGWKSISNLELMSIWVSSCSHSFIHFMSRGGGGAHANSHKPFWQTKESESTQFARQTAYLHRCQRLGSPTPIFLSFHSIVSWRSEISLI